MYNWRYVPFSTSHGTVNMAIDEYLLDQAANHDGPNAIRFYKWFPSTASIGYHQSLNAEVDRDAAKQNKVDIVRRISGGGAVFHDAEGEITYSIICRLSELPKLLDSVNASRTYDESIPLRYQPVLEALALGLGSLGIPIDMGIIHCPVLLMGGKKISGNAQAIRNNVLLQHGTILLKVQPELMYSVLKAPAGVPNTKMIQSVRAKVVGIYENTSPAQMATAPGEYMLIAALMASFENVFHMKLTNAPLTQSELEAIKLLTTGKYATQSWLEKYP